MDNEKKRPSVSERQQSAWTLWRLLNSDGQPITIWSTEPLPSDEKRTLEWVEVVPAVEVERLEERLSAIHNMVVAEAHRFAE